MGCIVESNRRCIFAAHKHTTIMETLFESNGFVIRFNGRSTYVLVTPTGNAVYAAETFRKCKNYYTRIFA
jgi:hypothetical protein